MKNKKINKWIVMFLLYFGVGTILFLSSILFKLGLGTGDSWYINLSDVVLIIFLLYISKTYYNVWMFYGMAIIASFFTFLYQWILNDWFLPESFLGFIPMILSTLILITLVNIAVNNKYKVLKKFNLTTNIISAIFIGELIKVLIMTIFLLIATTDVKERLESIFSTVVLATISFMISSTVIILSSKRNSIFHLTMKKNKSLDKQNSKF
ncbi:hypothetical protein ASO20_02850 [Mycoplasma sp. (ex Biomphalaria glabrata)]|uniref:hypothetical protein n=1 Tax=Mycoplasma sp. (ex Biomphalaria glabrata) TaxID=1749074 RepID=UPI00073ACFF3|nr:hypothetical protein [Mycoplasma sp. (ex Biomphalaria glabrata)]ALV23572.1 hypothetical protein ASO20_02850 [Mycoplasma sp. (ex Biomphalaria glabrata)]